jgi:hypothetical protein
LPPSIMGEGGQEAERVETWWDEPPIHSIPPGISSFSLLPSFSHDSDDVCSQDEVMVQGKRGGLSSWEDVSLAALARSIPST